MKKPKGYVTQTGVAVEYIIDELNRNIELDILFSDISHDYSSRAFGAECQAEYRRLALVCRRALVAHCKGKDLGDVTIPPVAKRERPRARRTKDGRICK